MTTTKTVSDFYVGQRVISTRIRDGMPIGSTGIVYTKDPYNVVVEMDEHCRRDRIRHWYFYPNQLDHVLVDIIGDNDDDCI